MIRKYSETEFVELANVFINFTKYFNSFFTAAFKINLNMAYPPVNGQSDPIMGGTFCKKEWLQEAPEFNILWNVFNSDECINSTQVFKPNHFCPMVKPKIMEDPVIIENTLDDQVENPSETSQDNVEMSKAIPITEFKAVNDIFKIVSDTTNSPPTDPDVLKRGNKTGKQFIVKHENSWTKFITQNKNFVNPADDKSTYKSRSHISTLAYNLVDGELVHESNIVYVGTGKKFINSNTKKEIPAEDMNKKIVVRYTTQINKGQPNLQRRTTYFIIVAPEEHKHLLNTCFVEYCGLDTDIGSSKTIHGNCRNPNKPYHR